MKPTLAANTVRLRPATQDDARNMLELLRAPEVRRFLCDDKLLSSDDVTDMLCKSAQLDQQGLGLWIIETKTAEFAGVVGLLPVSGVLRTLPEMQNGIEPIIALPQRFHGQGLATEAISAVILFAKSSLRLDRLVAAVDEPNERSHRLLSSSGFAPIGTTPGEAYKLILYDRRLDTSRDRYG